MKALLHVVALWRSQAGLLLAGAAVSLLTVCAGAGLALAAGRAVVPAVLGGAVLLWALRGLGSGRVMFRYVERMLTHLATFRALARLRIWMFRGLARRSFGGLGMMRSGDALARLVDDVQSLDGLYIRIAVPALSVLVLLPLLLAALWPGGPVVAIVSGLLLLAAAIAVPLLAARSALSLGAELTLAGSGLRVAALDALTGLPEVRAFAAEGRMLAAVQAREATLLDAQRRLARRGAMAQGFASLCGQAALLLVLLAGLQPMLLIPAVLLVLAAFETVAVMPRAGALLGLAAAGAQRIVAAAEGPPMVPEPAAPLPAPTGTGLRFEQRHLCLAGPPAGAGRVVARHAGRGARRHPWTIRLRQVHAGGIGAEGRGAAIRRGAARRRRSRQSGCGGRACADGVAEPEHNPVRGHDPRQPAARPA